MSLAKLSKECAIGKVPCLEGKYVWVWDTGALLHGCLSRDCEFEGRLFPRGCWLTLDPAGVVLEWSAYIVSEETIQGIPCKGGENVWYYGNGKLSLVILAQRISLRGVKYSDNTQLVLDPKGDVIDAVLLESSPGVRYQVRTYGAINPESMIA